jgi:hypothetical protein
MSKKTIKIKRQTLKYVISILIFSVWFFLDYENLNAIKLWKVDQVLARWHLGIITLLMFLVAALVSKLISGFVYPKKKQKSNGPTTA